MGMFAFISCLVERRRHRHADRARAEADAMLDRDEAAGEKILLSDQDFAGMKALYQSYGPDREQDREGLRRIARLAGRKL